MGHINNRFGDDEKAGADNEHTEIFSKHIINFLDWLGEDDENQVG